jgi:CelD/BcsL family acetyltransferase involved in cellulose biosynthesis
MWPAVEGLLIEEIDPLDLAPRWETLEARIPHLPFFRSWRWVGCLFAERFTQPVAYQARIGEDIVGLALCNRRGRRLFLGESGDAALDAPFIEHNGPLHLPRPEVEAGLLGALLRHAGTARLTLSGIGGETLAAVPGTTFRTQTRVAPWVDLVAVRAAGGQHLPLLSANARHQIRRSLRGLGEPVLRRAATTADGLKDFDAMVALHGESWRARGQPGAFASPWLLRFHRTLIARAFPRGEVDLLRLEAGARVFGYLYNFRSGGRVLAYQSGLATRGLDTHAKPGLSAHALAVQRAADAGDQAYDFLAGDQRYKRSLANRQTPLHWAEFVPDGSWLGRGLRLARRCGLLHQT